MPKMVRIDGKLYEQRSTSHPAFDDGSPILVPVEEEDVEEVELRHPAFDPGMPVHPRRNRGDRI